MFIKIKVIDSISLKPIKDFKVEVSCEKFKTQHFGDVGVLVGLPKNCPEVTVEIEAPLYKNITYDLTSDISEIVVGLDFIDVFEEYVVTA